MNLTSGLEEADNWFWSVVRFACGSVCLWLCLNMWGVVPLKETEQKAQALLSEEGGKNHRLGGGKGGEELFKRKYVSAVLTVLATAYVAARAFLLFTFLTLR